MHDFNHAYQMCCNPGKFVASHEGFALRMPAKDIANWQMTNDKGELVDIPRPAVALRVWNNRLVFTLFFLAHLLPMTWFIFTPSMCISFGPLHGSFSCFFFSVPFPPVPKVWDATAGDYESIDPLLHGAPATTEEAETW
jgi:hypothetical protein